MIEPIAKGLSQAEFTKYVAGDVAARMGVWRPSGFVLHNTAAPTLAQFYVDSYHGNKPLTGAQRVKNMWESYRRQKWAGGPHLIVTDREIILGNPLWQPGTHSPSWNATFWGLELAGDFDKETLGAAQRELAVHAMAELYSMLGHVPSESSFHFHNEDPRTTHKGCPGKKVGTKATWLSAVADHMASRMPGDCGCGKAVGV